nr:hypothetical protein [Streptomyces sp. DSM 41633]
RLDFVAGGRTDITDLTLACPKSNRLVREGGWTTQIRDDGRVEWIPPLHSWKPAKTASTTTGTPKTSSIQREKTDTAKKTIPRCGSRV